MPSAIARRTDSTVDNFVDAPDSDSEAEEMFIGGCQPQEDPGFWILDGGPIFSGGCANYSIDGGYGGSACTSTQGPTGPAGGGGAGGPGGIPGGEPCSGPLASVILTCNPAPPPPGYEECIAAALREVIASGEVPANAPNDGYGTVVQGQVIASPQFPALVGTRNAQIAPGDLGNLNGNPGILVRVRPGGPGQPPLNSTAFGRYQINAPTARDFGFTDFSPAGQDAAATTLMQNNGMLAAALAGNFAQAMQLGGRTWASLPGSGYGQPTMTMWQAETVFQNAVQTLPQCQ